MFGPKDDLRHWPAPGGRMRDSLFWEMIMPDERLGLQVYLYLTDRGRVGYNVAVWGPDREPIALDLGGGTLGPDMDLDDDFAFEGLAVKQPELRRTAEVSYTSDVVRLEYSFESIHDSFNHEHMFDCVPFTQLRTLFADSLSPPDLTNDPARHLPAADAHDRRERDI